MTVLVERGARVDVADGDGWTPLIEAVVFQPGIESNDDHRVRRRELVDLLLTHGASVDRRTADGMTPLMLAAAQGHMDIIRLLLKRGAVLTLTDGAGRNAEAAAERRSRHDAAELLKEVRLSGGTWKRYISEPRRDLVVLRVLCSRGRAMLSSNEGRLVGPSQGGALARLFPALAAAFGLAVDDDVGFVALDFGDGYPVKAEVPARAGQWHHYCLVYDDGNATLYYLSLIHI